MKILASKKSPVDIKNIAAGIGSFLNNASIMVKDEEFIKAGIANINGVDCFIKKYLNRGLIHTVKYLFRESKAGKNFRISEYLTESSVYFPHVYGMIKTGMSFLSSTTYLLMETINEIGDDDFYKDVVYAEKENLFYYIKKIAEQLNCLHEVNFFHGDSKRSNFFIDGSIDNYKAGVLDFDGSKIYRELPLRKRARDLGRFIASVMEEQNKYKKDFFSIQEIIDIIFTRYFCKDKKDILLKKIIANTEYHMKRKKLI